MFPWQEQYHTRSLRSLRRYCFCHSNIKFISSRHRVISSIYFLLYFSILYLVRNIQRKFPKNFSATYISRALNLVSETLPKNSHEVDLTAQKYVWCSILGPRDLGFFVMRKKRKAPGSGMYIIIAMLFVT